MAMELDDINSPAARAQRYRQISIRMLELAEKYRDQGNEHLAGRFDQEAVLWSNQADEVEASEQTRVVD